MSLEKYATDGERRVATRLVEELVSRGHSLTLWNGGDESEIEGSTDDAQILAEMAATEYDELMADGVWFLLVYGNAPDGSELIADRYANAECQEICERIGYDI